MNTALRHLDISPLMVIASVVILAVLVARLWWTMGSQLLLGMAVAAGMVSILLAILFRRRTRQV